MFEQKKSRAITPLRELATNSLSAGYFTNRAYPKVDQFESWRTFMSDAVDLRSIGSTRSGMEAEFSAWDMGGLLFSQTLFHGEPERQWVHWPRSYNDHWCLVLARYSTLERGVRRIRTSLSFRSLILPFEGRGNDSEVLTLLLPRDQFREEADALDRAVEAELAPAARVMLADYLESLARNLPNMDPFQMARMNAMTRAMVIACVAPTVETSDALSSAAGPAIVERARLVIRRNMASPDFGPDELCRLLAVSRSKLYRYFERLGGVARFIQRERLLEAHRHIADPQRSSSIQLVAADVGFLDHSTFSRAFRREFGYSPSEARERAMTGASAASSAEGLSSVGDAIEG